MWRIAAILAAIAAFVYIAVVGVQWLQPRVEDDILNRVNAALAEQGMLWADVTVSGREVVLGGHAPDEASHAEALNVASRVFGVASVSDATVVGNGTPATGTAAKAVAAKPAGAYQLTITKHENTLTVGGDVASAADADVIRRIVKTHFPDMQVEDTLKVNPHAPAGWRSAVGVVLMNITNLETANITISNTEVMLQGEVLDQKYSDQLQDAIKQALPKGYKAGFAVDVVTPAALAQEEAEASGTKVAAASNTLPIVATPTAMVADMSATTTTSTVANNVEYQPGFLSRLWSSISGETSSTEVSGGLITSMTTAISSTYTSVTTAIKHHHGKHEHKAKVAKQPEMVMTSHTTVAAVPAPLPPVPHAPPAPPAPRPVAPKPKAKKPVETNVTTTETTPVQETTTLASTDCHGIKRVARTVIYFGFDKAGLPQSARPTIRRVATTLKACPAQHVTVNGYTDVTGSALYNRWLSEQRAESGVRALRRQGVPGDQLSAVGHGEHRSKSAPSTKASRAHSRRIEFHPDGHPVAAAASDKGTVQGTSRGHARKVVTEKVSTETTTTETSAPATTESGWWNSMFGAEGTSATAPATDETRAR